MKAHIKSRIPMACLAFLLLVASLSSSSGSANITVGPGQSIQAAIKDASPGDVIEVKSGTYHEDLVIDKQLTLRGVDSDDGKPLFEANGCDGEITLLEDGITFEGFRLNGFGIDVISDGNIVRNHVIRKSWIGIGLYDSENNNIISHNDIECEGIWGPFGISLYQSHRNVFFKNDVKSRGFMGAGLFLNRCEDNIIKENSLRGGWLGNGIHLMESTNNVIVGNYAEDLSWMGRGIFLYSSNDNFVKGNNATGGSSACSVAIMWSNNNTIVQNNLTNNVDSGIKIHHSRGNVVYLNNFDRNRNDPLLGNSTSLWSSTEPIFYQYGGNNFTARLGNFWSGYSGPDAEGDGIGDAPRRFEGGEDKFPLMDRCENYSCNVEVPKKIFDPA